MQPEPEPESGRDGREGVCLRGKEGAQGEGVSHGRAPAGAAGASPAPAPRAPCLAAGPDGRGGSRSEFSFGSWTQEGSRFQPPPPRCLLGSKVMGWKECAKARPLSVGRAH